MDRQRFASRQQEFSVFRRGASVPRLFHAHNKTARENLWLLRFKICFVKVRRIEEIRDIDIQALAYLMDQAEFDRVIRAIHDISNRGFWHAAFHI